MTDQATATPLPRIAQRFSGLLSPLYRFFDWLYSSRYNPLYRSGTLAVGFLAVLLVTGTYLSVFYSVSKPYASVMSVDSQIFFGRWIRALHRYSTVACVIAVFFHVIQLMAQGKTWGPRLLAWVSGVVLTMVVFVSAWTGYVMVWDTHGQLVALAGARMLAVLPVLRELFDRSFNGSSELPPGFFFMNLFLHVALPLLMILGLWVHTSRLSRAVWFPDRTVFFWSLTALLGASLLFPAPLLSEADLLRVIGRIPIDISTGFWIPWLSSMGEWSVRLLLLVIAGCVAVIPWWWKPPSGLARPTSVVDEERCSGCTQCARDCPYEAITMIPRSDGKRLIAQVNPRCCVSCGICAASCADFAIGPPGRSALDQSIRAAEFSKTISVSGETRDLTIFACTNNNSLTQYLEQYCADSTGATFYPVECCGCMHTDVIEKLLQQSKGVALLGCPARNCLNRDGGDLLAGRIFEKRVPFLERSIDRRRLMVAAYSGSELNEVKTRLAEFRATLNNSVTESPLNSPNWSRRARSFLCSVVILAGVVLAAQWQTGTEIRNSVVRVSGLLPSFSAEKCHPPGAHELDDVPAHMRPKEICDRIPLQYELKFKADEESPVLEFLGGASNRVDRAIYLNTDKSIAPGQHTLHFELTAIEGNERGVPLECQSVRELAPGQIMLVQYDREKGQIACN